MRVNVRTTTTTGGLISTANGLLFYYGKYHLVLITSSFLFVTSRLTRSYLYHGLNSDGVEMGTPLP